MRSAVVLGRGDGSGNTESFFMVESEPGSHKIGNSAEGKKSCWY